MRRTQPFPARLIKNLRPPAVMGRCGSMSIDECGRLASPSARVQEPGSSRFNSQEGEHGTVAARSKLLSVSPYGREGACREAGLRGRLRPRPDPAREDRRRRSRSGVADLRAILRTVPMPISGDELHHFGWNACSSCLCPNAPHPHVERRYLVVPGLRSSRIHILDTKPDRRNPQIVKVIEPEELAEKTGYTRPHTIHCGPGGIFVTALGNAEGKAPGGIFIMDHESFEPLGQWEVERGPQRLAYDGWWHLGYDTMVTSEWGLPETFENGLIPDVLLGGRYAHKLHFWDLHKRKHVQELDFGAEHQLVFELRPAHDPTKAYGFVNCVISLEDLSSSIWTWHRDGDRWAAKKVITIPAEPASADDLPDLLKGFSAVLPLVTDIDLSMDDRFLYVSCWGTGDLRQY